MGMTNTAKEFYIIERIMSGIAAGYSLKYDCGSITVTPPGEPEWVGRYDTLAEVVAGMDAHRFAGKRDIL